MPLPFSHQVCFSHVLNVAQVINVSLNSHYIAEENTTLDVSSDFVVGGATILDSDSQSALHTKFWREAPVFKNKVIKPVPAHIKVIQWKSFLFGEFLVCFDKIF